jgi:hypothetical protein
MTTYFTFSFSLYTDDQGNNVTNDAVQTKTNAADSSWYTYQTIKTIIDPSGILISNVTTTFDS